MNKKESKKINDILGLIKKFVIKYRLFIIIGIIILILLIVLIVVRNDKKDKLLYDQIQEVKLEDIENLYKNVSNISCVGGIFFDFEGGNGTYSIDKVSKIGLLNYLFSYLDKNNLLSDEMSKNFIDEKTRELFYDKELLLFNEINDFQYGDYVYTIDGNTVKRLKKKCVSDYTYVTRLFGHTNTDEEVSMDIDLGKLVDGILYDMNGKKLGAYSEDSIKLMELFSASPYYRYNYVKVNGVYKLKSIGLISRG